MCACVGVAACPAVLQEVLGELLVEEASAYVLGQEEADLQLNQVCVGGGVMQGAARVGCRGVRGWGRRPAHMRWL